VVVATTSGWAGRAVIGQQIFEAVSTTPRDLEIRNATFADVLHTKRGTHSAAQERCLVMLKPVEQLRCQLRESTPVGDRISCRLV